MDDDGPQSDQALQPCPGSVASFQNMARQYDLDPGLPTASHLQKISAERDFKYDLSLAPFDLLARDWHPDFISTGARKQELTGETLRKQTGSKRGKAASLPNSRPWKLQ